MKAADIKSARDTTPFRPFAIRTDDGRVSPVPHPDFLMLLPNQDVAIIAKQPAGFSVIDTTHIVALDYVEANH